MPSTGSDDDDRRGDHRLGVNWPGTVALADGAPVACEVSDVSTAGACICGSLDAAVGAEVLLEVPGLGEFAGTVQWARPPHFGLALQAGPDLALKSVAEESPAHPGLAAPAAGRRA